jgi:ketosteroid isomerase-like protein
LSSDRLEAIRQTTSLVSEGGAEALGNPAVAEAVRARVHPDAACRVHGNSMMGEVYRGPEGWLRMQTEWAEMWGRIAYEIERLEERGDRVLAVVHYTGAGVSSGAAVDSRVGQVFEYDGDRLVRMDVFHDPRAAIEAFEAA